MHISRTCFGSDIITEFVAPKNRKSNKVMIFCSGVPSTPSKDEVLSFFARKGYWSFFPRYRGCWESRGVFLRTSPEDDVREVLDGLDQPFKDFWSGKVFKVNAENINIVGSSFGGPAAILLTRDERVNKAVCISPVVDWKAEHKSEPLLELYNFLNDAYGNAYNLDKRYWNKLTRGQFYNPAFHEEELDGSKIMIFHAKDDDIVRIKPVAKFSKRIGAHFLEFKRGGHLSSSLLMSKRYFKMVDRFLRS